VDQNEHQNTFVANQQLLIRGEVPVLHRVFVNLWWQSYEDMGVFWWFQISIPFLKRIAYCKNIFNYNTNNWYSI